MSSKPPRGWTRKLADHFHRLRLKQSWSIEQLTRKAAKVPGCGGITHRQVEILLSAPPTLTETVVSGVASALGVDAKTVARLKAKGLDNG